MNFIGDGGTERERGDYRLYWAAATSMPLSENIEGTTAHFILNSIHCCSRTSYSPLCTSSPLRLPPCWGARQHVPQTFCQSSVAHPTQAELSFLSRCCRCCCCWSCKQIAQFFFWVFFCCFLSFLFSASACSTCRCRLPHAAARRRLSTYYLVKGVRRLQFEIVMAKRETALATTRRRRGEGRGEWKSEKWKVEKPNEKEREKYLLCSLVGFPVPCLLAPKAII